MKFKDNPIVIVGMHRSGTTMLTKIFHKYGFYMGAKVEQNSEAIGFLRLNENILLKCNSKWDNPNSVESELDSNKKELVNYLKRKIKKKSFKKEYFGNLESKKVDSLVSWGWKDPRNTFMISLWREIFPSMKIIHIYRNPIDVANSLKNREKKFSENGLLKWWYNVIKNYIINRIFVKRSPDLLNLNYGIELWKKYVVRALNIKGDIIHIKYEDFLENPLKNMELICKFLKLDFNVEQFNTINIEIDKNRKYAFMEDKELMDKYLSIKNDDVLIKTGYNNLF